MMKLGALIWEEMRNLFMFHTWTPSNVTPSLGICSESGLRSGQSLRCLPLPPPTWLNCLRRRLAILLSPQLPLPLVGLASRCAPWLLDTHTAWSQPSANTLTFSEMTFAFLSLIRKAIKKKMHEKEDNKPPMIPCPKYTCPKYTCLKYSNVLNILKTNYLF